MARVKYYLYQPLFPSPRMMRLRPGKAAAREQVWPIDHKLLELHLHEQNSQTHIELVKCK